MHDGNLPGRAAKADEAQFKPEHEGLPETNGLRGQDCVGDSLRFGLIHCEDIPLLKLANNPSNTGVAAVSSSSSPVMVSRSLAVHTFHANRFGRLHTADIEVMHHQSQMRERILFQCKLLADKAGYLRLSI